MRLPTPTPLRDAETNSVWVVVPFSRPENLTRVVENFARQKFPFKKLVLVANGRARKQLEAGAFDVPWAEVFTCEAHQSAAKNTALAEIRKRGGGFTVVMDDDDWYGPQYLTEACGYARTFDVIGKRRHFVSVDGQLWLCSREQRNRVGDDWLTGGTIACWAEDAPEYPLVKWGEDVGFCLAALRRGMKVRSTDLYHYVYRRDSTTDHAWQISAEELRRTESQHGALDLGREDLRIVEGRKLDVEGRRLESQEEIDTLKPPPPQEVSHVRT